MGNNNSNRITQYLMRSARDWTRCVLTSSNLLWIPWPIIELRRPTVKIVLPSFLNLTLPGVSLVKSVVTLPSSLILTNVTKMAQLLL